MSKKNIHFVILCIVVLLHNGYGSTMELKQQEKMVADYATIETNTIIETIRNDLLSEDALLQDAGCIILLKTLERQKQGDKKSQFVFAQLADDKKVVSSAADIIDSRLLGWYNREIPEDHDDNIKLYIPLFYILGISDSKTARGTLVRSFLYLSCRTGIFKEIPISEEVIAISLKRLKVIEEKLCCVYPGRDIVAMMQEKDLKFTMLEIFENHLTFSKTPNEKMKYEIKEHVVECMKYGDSKNGHIIRIKAAVIAGMLVNGWEKDLAHTIEDLSKNDPYYYHKYKGTTGYSMTELNYPVREICSKILLR